MTLPCQTEIMKLHSFPQHFMAPCKNKMKQKLIPFFFLVVKWRSTNMIIWLITTKCKFWVLQRNTTLMQANGFFLVTICQDTYQKHVQSRGWHGFKASPLIWWQPSIKLTANHFIGGEILEREWDSCLLSLLTDWDMIA